MTANVRLSLWRWTGVLRVLCHNCNHSYGAYGYCSHQRDTQTG